MLRGGTKAKWGEMDTVHIINRSLSERIEGVSEVARRKVGLLPQLPDVANPIDAVSTFQSMTGQRPPEALLNTLEGSPCTTSWVLKTSIVLGTL